MALRIRFRVHDDDVIKQFDLENLGRFGQRTGDLDIGGTGGWITRGMVMSHTAFAKIASRNTSRGETKVRLPCDCNRSGGLPACRFDGRVRQAHRLLLRDSRKFL